MSTRMQYFLKRAAKIDRKAMWKTTKLLKKRSGKSRAWLMKDMLQCAVKYNAGYIDYKIAEMYRLNDEQRRTVITRGISNEIVRRMNPKEFWHFFDDKAEFNALFSEYIPRKWLKINAETNTDDLFSLCRGRESLIGKPLEGSSGQGIKKYTAADWQKGPEAFLRFLGRCLQGQHHEGRAQVVGQGDQGKGLVLAPAPGGGHGGHGQGRFAQRPGRFMQPAGRKGRAGTIEDFQAFGRDLQPVIARFPGQTDALVQGKRPARGGKAQLHTVFSS